MRLFAAFPYRVPGTTRTSIESPIDAWVELADPVIYLHGLPLNERSEASPSTIRGTVSVSCKRDLKVIQIVVKLVGKFMKSDVLVRDNKKLVSEDVDILEESVALFKSENEEIYFKTDIQYEYPFEFRLEATMPESISTIYGSIIYETKVMVGFVDQNQIDFYMRHPTRLVELNSQEIKVLRSVAQISTSASESIIVEGIWRNSFDYKFVAFKKVLKIETDLVCNICITPIEKLDYKVHSIKIYLTQQISLNADKDHHFHKLNQTQKIILKEYTCLANDFANDGSLSLNWSLPIKEFYRKDGQFYRIYPFTSHPELAQDVPHLKITHSLKILVLLGDLSTKSSTRLPQIVSRQDESPRGGNLFSMVFSNRFPDQSIHRDTSDFCYTFQDRQKRIELSFTAPIYLLHQNSLHEVPPSYHDSLKSLVSDNTSVSEAETNEKKVTSVDFTTNLYKRDGKDQFWKPTKAQCEVSRFKGELLSKKNRWFDLVGKWTEETPPEY